MAQFKRLTKKYQLTPPQQQQIDFITKHEENIVWDYICGSDYRSLKTKYHTSSHKLKPILYKHIPDQAILAPYKTKANFYAQRMPPRIDQIRELLYGYLLGDGGLRLNQNFTPITIKNINPKRYQTAIRQLKTIKKSNNLAKAIELYIESVKTLADTPSANFFIGHSR